MNNIQMNYSQLNKNAAVFHFEISRISKALKEFFSILFTSWPTNFIVDIIFTVSIETMYETEKFFKELFLNVYQLASDFQSGLICENIVVTINSLDIFLPEILISKSNKTPAQFLLDYEGIKKRSFQECFCRIKASIKLLRECNFVYPTIITEIENVLKALIKLCEIKYCHSFLYTFALFLLDIFYEFHDLMKIRHLSLSCLIDIFPKLLQFLLLNIEENNYKESGEFVLRIFKTLKSDLINCKFSENEANLVLIIIELHDQFIGRYVDGVPENFYKDGFVICSSATGTFESDEFYEDYENFKLNIDD